MRRFAIALAWLAGACTTIMPATTPVVPTIAQQPDELRWCNAAPPGVPPPPLPRTTEAGLAWGQKAEDLRGDTARIATTCRDRLLRLNRWIDDLRAH